MPSKPNFLVELRRPEAVRRWASTLGMSPGAFRSVADTARSRAFPKAAQSTATQHSKQHP